MLRVLIASDDRDLSLARLQELVSDQTLAEMSDVLPSDGARQALVESGLRVALCSLDNVAETLEARVRLGFAFDAILLLTIRPYRSRGDLLRRAVERIRKLPESLCSRGGLRASTLPIVLVDVVTLLTGTPPPDADYEGLSRLDWCYLQPPGGTLGQALAHAVGAWRSELLLELDWIGYAISFNELGELQVDHALRRKQRESPFFTREASPDSLRKDGFLRLGQDLVEAALPYRRLEVALNRLRTLPPQEQEPLLQRCLDENPMLIYRNLFVRHHPQLRLRHPDPFRQAIIPDFILQPEAGLEESGSWEVMEIKTSEQAVLRRRKFTAFFLEALRQLEQQYADYFRSSRTAPEQVRALGHVLRAPRLALVIGRRLDEEGQALLEDARRSSEWNAIQILSYDDLLEVGSQALQLEKRMRIAQREQLS